MSNDWKRSHCSECACALVSSRLATIPGWRLFVLSIGHNHGTNQITTSISSAFVISFCWPFFLVSVRSALPLMNWNWNWNCKGRSRWQSQAHLSLLYILIVWMQYTLIVWCIGEGTDIDFDFDFSCNFLQ